MSVLQQLYTTGSAESWTRDRMGEMASKVRREAKALTTTNNTNNTTTNKSGSMYNTYELLEGYDETTLLPSTPSSLLPLTGSGSATVPKPEKMVDLESMAFTQGGHLMTNTRCELPEKSWRAQKKGYEEVHVPAVRPIIPSDERLVDITDLPEWTQPAFVGIKQLNRIQSRTVKTALYTSENILLCAPTSSGKTNIAMLCMLNIIGQYRDNTTNTIDLNAFKIVYIAPMKALVQECVQSFSKRLSIYNINVRELSGDQNLSREQIQDTQVIITTPEKWVSVNSVYSM